MLLWLFTSIDSVWLKYYIRGCYCASIPIPCSGIAHWLVAGNHHAGSNYTTESVVYSRKCYKSGLDLLFCWFSRPGLSDLWLNEQRVFLYCPQAKNGFNILKGYKRRKKRRRRGRKRATATTKRKKKRKRWRRRRNRDPLFSKNPGNKCFGCVGYVVSVRTAQLFQCSIMAVLQ